MIDRCDITSNRCYCCQ